MQRSGTPPGIPPPAEITPGTIVPMTVEPVVGAVPPPRGLCIEVGLAKRDNEANPLAVRSPPNRGGTHAILPSRIWLISWSAASIGWDTDVFLYWLKKRLSLLAAPRTAHSMRRQAHQA